MLIALMALSVKLGIVEYCYKQGVNKRDKYIYLTCNLWYVCRVSVLFPLLVCAFKSLYADGFFPMARRTCLGTVFLCKALILNIIFILFVSL